MSFFLPGIINHPELLLETLAPDSEYRQPLEEILAAGQRAAAVVSDLLTMARGVAMTKKSVSLNDLVQEYLQSLEGKALSSKHPEVTIHFLPDPDLWRCSCSSIHITKVVMNLVVNAMEAVEGKGDVYITICNQEVGKYRQGGFARYDLGRYERLPDIFEYHENPS